MLTDMTPTPITVKNGKGKAVNPFEPFGKDRAKWLDFEPAHPELPVRDIPDTAPGETVEAYLQWQYRVVGYEKWYDCTEPKELYDACFDESRQIYVLSKEGEGKKVETKTLQDRVSVWLVQCFGDKIAKDIQERNHRFLEESLELVQSLGCSKEDAHMLVDYVFGREIGEPFQEVGGTMITLAALCSASGLDMDANAETEYNRINQPEIIEKIRKKQATKPAGALPQ
jgi:hypothetical protein